MLESIYHDTWSSPAPNCSAISLLHDEVLPSLSISVHRCYYCIGCIFQQKGSDGFAPLSLMRFWCKYRQRHSLLQGSLLQHSEWYSYKYATFLAAAAAVGMSFICASHWKVSYFQLLGSGHDITKIIYDLRKWLCGQLFLTYANCLQHTHF